MVERLLDASVADEHKGTGFEIEIYDTRTKALLEPFKIGMSRLGDCLLKIRDVFRTFRELSSTNRNELFGGDAKVLGRSEVGGFENIKRKKRVNTMNHIIRRITSRSMNSDPFGPKDLREHLAPLRFITFAGLDDGFANVKMLGLYDAVGSGIVARNPDVTDTVAGCQDVECGNIGRGIVGDEFFETAPATEDVLEDKVCHDFSRVRGGSATFGIHWGQNPVFRPGTL